jgi:secreted PhoX family phosphatase
MTTSLHNGFTLGANPTEVDIDHGDHTKASALVGTFGNNWLFYVPVSGPDAGEVIPFAYGPPRCEMTGPTFVDDTLIISVQHPSEDSPINDGTADSLLTRKIEMLKLNGSVFTQKRTLPRGSNWPSHLPVADGGKNNPTGPPRPSVMGIRKRP